MPSFSGYLGYVCVGVNQSSTRLRCRLPLEWAALFRYTAWNVACYILGVWGVNPLHPHVVLLGFKNLAGPVSPFSGRRSSFSSLLPSATGSPGV